MAKVWPGNNYPLGAFYDGAGTNFSIFSEIANRVELCLFNEGGTETKYDLPEVTSAGMVTYLTLGPASVMAFVCTAHGSLRKAIAAIRQSCSWTLMRGPSKDKHDGMRLYFRILSIILMVHRTTSTARPPCLNAS